MRSDDCSEISLAQKRIWFLEQLIDDNCAWIYQASYELTDKFSQHSFLLSTKHLMKKHSAICSRFYESEGRVCVKNDTLDPETLIEIHDISSVDEGQKRVYVKNFVEDINTEAMSSRAGKIFKIDVIVTSEDNIFLFFRVHKIISDERSVITLINDFIGKYKSLIDSKELTVAHDEVMSANLDFIKEESGRKGLSERLQFWESDLDEMPVKHSLPLDAPRNSSLDYNEGRYEALVEQAVTRKISQLALQQNVSEYIVVKSVFCILLSRFGYENDIVIGTPVSARIKGEDRRSVGCHSSHLLLRNKVVGSESFSMMVEKVNEKYQHALDNYVSYEQLIDHLKPQRFVNFSPLCQVLFDFTCRDEPFNDSNVKFLNNSAGRLEEFDLRLNVIQGPEGLKVEWRFNKNLFNTETIVCLAREFIGLLEVISVKPDALIKDMVSTSSFDMKLHLDESNTEVEDVAVHEKFEDQVKKLDNSPAVVFGGQCWTYGEINKKANRLASLLRERNIGVGEFVGVLMPRGDEAIVSILAILKAGCAYIPLDPVGPVRRINSMIMSSRPSCIITASEFVGGLKDKEISILCLDRKEIVDALERQSCRNQGIGNSNRAALIFTSGSTGEPKGVVLSHRNIINRVIWAQKTFPLQEDEVCVHRTSLSFVDHISEIFHPLCNGVKLVVFPDKDIIDSKVFIDKLKYYRASRLSLVPFHIGELVKLSALSSLTDLKLVFSSGESLSLECAVSLLNALPGARLINMYGSTEVCGDATYHEFTKKNYESLLEYFNSSREIDFRFRNQEGLFREEKVTLSKYITEPDVSLSNLKSKFHSHRVPARPLDLNSYVDYLDNEVIPYTVNVSEDKYVGHMTSALPDFIPEFSKLVTVLNQNMVKVETSKSLSLLERQVLGMTHHVFFENDEEFYGSRIQDPMHVFGIITSGGSLANLTALMVARNKALIKIGYSSEVVKKEGASYLLERSSYSKFVILCSRLAHYSVRKSAIALGFGENSIKIIEQDDKQKASIEDLKSCLKNAEDNNELVIAIFAIAGATETGTIDPIDEMGAISRKYNVHFHVDAAWGGAFKFSGSYRHKLYGIEKADSITFCAHKQLYISQGISVCLFGDTQDVGLIPIHANYQSKYGSYDLGQFSLEGSRPALSLLLHSAYHLIGANGYEMLVNESMKQTNTLSNMIKNHAAFRLVIEPELNILNYYYMPVSLRSKQIFELSETELDELGDFNAQIQKRQFERGISFVSQTKVLLHKEHKDLTTVFRVVISNPLVNVASFQCVLADQLEIARKFESGVQSNPVLDYFRVPEDVGEQYKHRWSVPIGKPISNTEVILLDRNKRLAPIGGLGEIYIGGTSLSQGYIKTNTSNDDAYIDHPCRQGRILYKTGDIGRLRPDGLLEFVGRLDDQVKIRGHRIEVSEIESAIIKIDNIESAAVLAVGQNYDDNNKARMSLVAYVKSKRGSNFQVKGLLDSKRSFEIKAILKESLPSFMIPEVYVAIEKMPLTVSGKVNKRLLPVTRIEKNYVKPRSKNEIEIFEIWCEVLGSKSIGLDDNFFVIGGNSLMVVNVLNKIKCRLGKEISFLEFYENSTIELLSSLVGHRSRRENRAVNAAGV